MENVQRCDNSMLYRLINVSICSEKYKDVESKGVVVDKLKIINRVKYKLTALIMLFVLLPSTVFSDEIFTNPRWDGYISQSMIYTSDNNFFGKSDDSVSFDFTEIEFLFSTTFLSNFQLSGSLLSRRAGESDDGSIRLDHGFITYTAINDIDWSIGLRAGRIKAPQGFYNETRDVAFTRPGILVPQSIYLERYRDWLFSTDGLEFFAMRSWAENSLSFRLLGSRQDPSKEAVEELLATPGYPIGDIKDGETTVGKLLYEHDTGRIRLALSYGSTSYKINNNNLGFGALPETAVSTSAVFLSGEYNTNKWKFVGEYVPSRNKILNLLSLPGRPATPDQDTKGLSYYLQSTYRINPKWDVMLRRGVLYIDKHDKTGATLSANTGYPAHSFYAKNWVLGMGWHFSDSLLFRAEFYDIEGTGWVPIKDFLYSMQQGSLHKDWQMFMLQASYRF